MALVQPTNSLGGAAADIAARSLGRKRIQMDVGFAKGGNLDSFKCGGRLRSYPLKDSISQMEGAHGRCDLLMGIGAGAVAPVYAIFDITALGFPYNAFDFQGFGGPDGMHFPITRNRLRMEELEWRSGQVRLFPIAQFLFGSEIAMEERTGFSYMCRTLRRASFREILAEAAASMDQGKMFALIDGEMEDVVFRPIKPEGPLHGRPFAAGREPDSDVVWIQGAMGFQGTIVTSLDSSSYTAVHAHMIGLCPVFTGGHIEEATVKEGASLIMLKGHEVFGVDRYG